MALDKKMRGGKTKRAIDQDEEFFKTPSTNYKRRAKASITG